MLVNFTELNNLDLSKQTNNKNAALDDKSSSFADKLLGKIKGEQPTQVQAKANSQNKSQNTKLNKESQSEPQQKAVHDEQKIKSVKNSNEEVVVDENNITEPGLDEQLKKDITKIVNPVLEVENYDNEINADDVKPEFKLEEQQLADIETDSYNESDHNELNEVSKLDDLDIDKNFSQQIDKADIPKLENDQQQIVVAHKAVKSEQIDPAAVEKVFVAGEFIEADEDSLNIEDIAEELAVSKNKKLHKNESIANEELNIDAQMPVAVKIEYKEPQQSKVEANSQSQILADGNDEYVAQHLPKAEQKIATSVQAESDVEAHINGVDAKPHNSIHNIGDETVISKSNGELINESPKQILAGQHIKEAPQTKNNNKTVDHLIDQIKVDFHNKAKTDDSKITVQLRPEHLGKVEVSLEMSGNQIKAMKFVAETKEAADILQREAFQLEKSIAKVTGNNNAANLSFDFKNNQQGQNFNNSNGTNSYQQFNEIFEEKEQQNNLHIGYVNGYVNQRSHQGGVSIQV